MRDHILPVVLDEGFAEVVVAGDGASGDGYRHLNIPKITGTTTDALMKRDAAAVATTAEYVFYLCDDHRPLPGSLCALQDVVQDHAVDALIPARITVRDGRIIPLNSGAADGYCGGHAGVFHRETLQLYPWTTAPHDRLWDLYHSRRLVELGVQFHYAPEVIVEDIEHFVNPRVEPWR